MRGVAMSPVPAAAAAAAAAAFLLYPRSAAAGTGALLQDGAAAAFREQGFLLTRGTLDRTEVGSVAATLAELLARHGRRAFGGEGGQKEVRFTFAVHELDERVAAFVGDPGSRLWKAASELAGTEAICLLMDRGFSKDPGDPETHWHRDDEAIGLPQQHPELRTVHAWVPLSSMGSDMGTLRYLAGTHQQSYGWLMHLLASVWGWEFAWYMTSRVVQDDALELGDIAWHDGWVLHAAGSNAGTAVRNGLAASFAYCAAGPGNCSQGAAWKSATDPTCRVAAWMFDADWLERHRSGENDYAKTLLQEPLSVRATRFAWRSLLGAVGGLGAHRLLISCSGSSESKPKTA